MWRRPTGPGHTEPWLKATGLLGVADALLGEWQSAHEAAADRRQINAVARFRRDHPQMDSYAEVTQSRWKPMDAPRPGTRADVARTDFHGTYTEKAHWFWGKNR